MTLRQLIHKCLGWCPLYQIALGGYRYYQHSEESRYRPSQFIHFGRNARLGEDVLIDAPGRCYIGDNAAIGSNCRIGAIGGFHLGNYSGIAEGSMVLTTEHRFIGACALPFDRMRQVKPVYIGDFVWVGTRSMILSGVRIGDGAVVGMGSVVTRDVPPLAIVTGNPATAIGRRSQENFDALKQKGRGRDPYDRCCVLWVPPFIQRKYRDELKEIGFEVMPEEEYFLDDKSHKAAVRISNAEASRMSLPSHWSDDDLSKDGSL